MKKYVRQIASALLLCMLLSITACGTQDPGTAETTSDIESVGSIHESTAPETEAETEAVGSIQESTAEPETETEGLQIEITPESPTGGTLITFYENSANAVLIGGKYCASSIVTDGDASVLKMTTDGDKVRNPTLTFDYATYMQLLGLDSADWNSIAYAVVTLKTENVTGSECSMTIFTEQNGTSYKSKGTATYVRNSKDWQTVIVPFSHSEKEGAVMTSLRLDFADTEKGGETVYVKSIQLASDKAEVLEITGKQLVTPSTATVTIPGLSKEYTLLQVSDLHSSAYTTAEAKAMNAQRRSYIAGRRNAFTDGFMFAEERMPYMFGYANEINADLLMLTGDIIDFPSELNIELMAQNIAALKTPALFSLGNHDWCYADDYLSAAAAAEFIPKLNALSAGEPANDPYVKYVDFGEFMVVQVDNSPDSVSASTVDKFLELCALGKPIILMLHVPLHVDSMVADCTKVWGKDLGMGGDTGVCAWSPDVQRFYHAVAEDENTPVVAVFAGHVHFNHEDVLPNGVTQYITSTAYTGECRVITVKGE